MSHYPVFLNLRDQPVLLVGGGMIALQKLPALLEAGARVHVVAPKVLADIESWGAEGRLRWSRRPYQSSDMDGMRLAIAATDDAPLQSRIAADARQRGIWVNVVDVPPLCDFIAPAVVRQGDLQVAISTGGAAPALAKHLRRKLEKVLGAEYAQFVEIVKPLRPAILKLPRPQRQKLWEQIVSDTFLEDIKLHGPSHAEARLKELIHGCDSRSAA